MKDILDVLKIMKKQAKMKMFTLTLTYLGVISSLVTLVAGIAGYKGYGVEDLRVFIMISFIASLVQIYNSLKKIEIKVGNDTNLTIKIGNILENDGVMVIPMDEYFYPKVDGNRIVKGTIHGKFINTVYQSDTDKLKNSIQNEIQRRGLEETGEIGIDNKKKYPVGTTLNIEERGKDYMLLALSKFKVKDGTYNAYLDNIDEYLAVLDSLLNHIHIHSQGRKIYIPLIGGGLSRVALEKQEILETFINKLKLKKGLSVPGGIEIVIYKGDIDEINFKRLKAFEN